MDPVERKFTDADADGIEPPPGERESGMFVSKELRTERLDVCRGCPFLFKPTYTCKKCGCFMAAKTWLVAAGCPEDKWRQ